MTVLRLYLLGFLSNFTAGILIPTLPLYIQGMGTPVILISSIVAIYGLGKIVGLVYLGHQSDRRGRGAILAMELCSFAVFGILLTLAHHPLLVLALAIPYGLAGNVPTVVTAAVGDVTNSRNIDLLMAGFMLSIGLGFSIGNFVGGYSVTNWGFSVTYYLMTLFSLFALSVVAFSLKDIWKNQAKSTDNEPMFKRMRTLIRLPRVSSTGAIAMVINAGQGLSLTFFPLLASQIGMSAADIGLILGVRGLCSTAVRFPIGFVGRPSLRYKVMVAAPLISSLAVALMSFAHSFNQFLMVVPLEGVAQGIFLTVSRTEVADATRGNNAGIGLGVLDMFSFSGQTFFVFALGGVAAFLGLQPIFAVGAVIILVGLGFAAYIRMAGMKGPSLPEVSPSRHA